MIRLDNVSKQVGHQILFIEASAALQKGEKIGLVGPNGAGKTTLFRMISGQEPPDEGQVSLVSRDAQSLLEPADIELTPRERDVLVLMAEGASNKAIARQLGISVHTAKFHVGSLLDKLDATGRTDAVAHAARRGVIHL